MGVIVRMWCVMVCMYACTYECVCIEKQNINECGYKIFKNTTSFQPNQIKKKLSNYMDIKEISLSNWYHQKIPNKENLSYLPYLMYHLWIFQISPTLLW